jgi:hypothetical protein
MQDVIDRWNTRRREQIPPALSGSIAPTRIEGINLVAAFRFPIGRFAGHPLALAPVVKKGCRGAARIHVGAWRADARKTRGSGNRTTV